jgi:hypothetical protein
MILRKKLTSGYTAMPTATLCDPSISFRALGVLSYLLSRPDNWRVNYRGLMRSTARPGREAKDAIRTALRELSAAGYRYVKPTRDADGKFRTEVWISDTRMTEAEWEIATVRGFPEPGKPEPGKPESGFAARLESTEEVSTEEGGAAPQDRIQIAVLPDSDTETIEASPAGPTAARRAELSLRIDDFESIPDPELSRLRDALARSQGALSEARARALDEIRALVPVARRAEFQRWADGHVNTPQALIDAHAVACDTASRGSVDIAIKKLAGDKLQMPNPGTPEYESFQRASDHRDLLIKMTSQIRKLDGLVEQRQAAHRNVHALRVALAKLESAGGFTAWADERARRRDIPGGIIRVLSDARDWIAQGRQALRLLGVDAADFLWRDTGVFLAAIEDRLKIERAAAEQQAEAERQAWQERAAAEVAQRLAQVDRLAGLEL